MLKSMTGFGRIRKISGDYEINIDVKSVNHRYLDLNIKLPKYYIFLEDKIRENVSSYITRGKTEVSVFIKRISESERKISLNESLCDNYYNVLSALKEKLGTDEEIGIRLLSRFSDIFETEYVEENEEEVVNAFIPVLKECLSDFVSMREREGERIKKDLLLRLDRINKLDDEVEKRAPEIVKNYQERLYNKLKEIVPAVDETRVLTEAAIYADKITTSEETVRLKSHIKEFKHLLESENAVGKKLDFLVQEMNRETNTIGSKCNDFDTSKIVVDLKSEIENIREQIQNIE